MQDALWRCLSLLGRCYGVFPQAAHGVKRGCGQESPPGCGAHLSKRIALTVPPLHLKTGMFVSPYGWTTSAVFDFSGAIGLGGEVTKIIAGALRPSSATQSESCVRPAGQLVLTQPCHLLMVAACLLF